MRCHLRKVLWVAHAITLHHLRVDISSDVV